MTDPRTYGLTPRAAELLAVLREWRTMHGVMPTYRQMAAEVELNVTGVHRLVAQLEERGLIRKLPRCRQSIALFEPQTITLPEDVAIQLRHAARDAGRTPAEHVAALVRHHCHTSSPF